MESEGKSSAGNLPSCFLQNQKLHFFLCLILIISPLLCALIPSPYSPCVSNPFLDDRWYQRRPPVTLPADKIKSKLEELEEKVSQVCAFLFHEDVFVLWLTPESTVCSHCCSFDWTTFSVYWTVLTHTDPLQVSTLNWQMARGNYVYAKRPAI